MSESQELSRRERQIMDIVYRVGRATAAEVHRRLPEAPTPTAVRTLIRILEEKGHVRHEKEGRAYRYYPVVQQETAGGSALNRLVDKVFHGSASMLLAQLVTERNLPPGELQRMRTLLDERLAGLEDEE
jgi:predicted transcriptional regulator